jgi:hypothetical protein
MWPFKPKTLPNTKITFKNPILINGKMSKVWTKNRPAKLTFKPRLGLVKVFLPKTDRYNNKTIYFSLSQIVSIQQYKQPKKVVAKQVAGY